MISLSCGADAFVQGFISGVQAHDVVVEVNRTGIGWQVLYEESGNTTGYFEQYYPVALFTFMTESRITATDGNGCVESTTTTYPTTFVGVAAWNWDTYTECMTQQAFVKLYLNQLPPPPTFSVDGGPQQSFAAGWTLVGSPGYYRMNTPWPSGLHTLAFPAYNSGPYVVCAQSKQMSGTAAPCVGVTVRGALGGALPSGTLMTDNLRANGLIPTADPGSGNNAGAGISTGVLATTGNNAIVDWVTVELRSPGVAGNLVASTYGLLQRDGDVVERNGTSGIRLQAAPGSYNVVLRHRNHQAVMTAAPITLGADPATALVDFRLGSTATYGSAARLLKGTVWCLWAGEARPDGVVKYTGEFSDRDAVLSVVGGATPNNVITNVYDNRDLNLDGQVRYTGANNDRDIILTNVGSTTPNNTRVQQLP